MKGIKFLLAIVTLVVIFSKCTENDNVQPNPISSDSLDAPLTDEQAAFLETVKDTVIRLEDIVLENGLNVRSFLEKNDPGFLQANPSGRMKKTLSALQQKNLFLSRMIAMGNNLVDRTRHVYPAEGNDKPFHFGLAYSWGSKDHTIRQVPPGGGGCTTLKIYGLDCSGMMLVMTKAASLTVVPEGAFSVKNISDAQKWTNAFKASSDYEDLKMKDMGMLRREKIKNGDIILWSGHVGVFINGYFYQSNGKPDSPSCNNNLTLGRGPRLISLSEALGFGLGNFKIFRIITDLKFTFALKYYNDYLIYPGVVSKDTANMKIEIKDEIVTCSDFINGPGVLIPASKTDEKGCTVTWDVLDYLGPINLTSGSGFLVEGPEGQPQLKLTIAGTSHAPAATYVCPATPVLQGAAGYGPFVFNSIEFNLNDSIPTYKDPSGVFMVKLIPEE